MTDREPHEGRAEEGVALRWFCAFGALVTFATIANFVLGLEFGPRTLPLPWYVYAVVGMSALCFVLYINVSAANSPCSCAPSTARERGTLLTVCTFIVIILHENVISATFTSNSPRESWDIVAFCVVTSIPLVPWCSGVSGLGLWPPGERWTYAIGVGMLTSICAFLILGFSLFIVAAWSYDPYYITRWCPSDTCYYD